jgi:hypothetical protein
MENWPTSLGKNRISPHATYRSYRNGSKSGLCRPLGDRWDYLRKLRGKGALEVGSCERVVRLFTTEVISEKTLGKWRHFIKPIYRIKH